MTTQNKPYLCFHVSGGNDPEMDMVVFARSSIEAKRDWANEHGNGDRYIAGISAKRCKGWDKHAPGPVPALEMIEDGWHFECHGCSRTIDRDRIEWGLDEDDEGNPAPPMQPYEPSPQCIWCSRSCHDDDMAKRKRIATLKRRAIAVVCRKIMRAFPGVTLPEREYSQHAYVNRRDGRLLIHDVRVRFEVPGMKHGGCQYRIDDVKWRDARVEEHGPDVPGWLPLKRRWLQLPISERKRETEVTVANGDLDVWNAWRFENAKSTEPA